MIRAWVGIIISLVAFVAVLMNVDLESTAAVLGRVAPVPIIAAVVLVALQVILVSFRWSILLPVPRSRGAITTRETIGPVLVGYLGNVALPARLGDAARAVLIARRHRISTTETIGSVVLERLADTATGALVALVLAITLGAPPWVVQLSALAAVASTLVVGVLAAFGVEGLVRRIGGWLEAWRPSLAERTVPAMLRLEQGMRIDGRRPAVAVASLLSFANWLLEGMIYWLVALSLGIQLGVEGALLVAAVTVLATAIPAAPGYLGTFELAAVAVTTALGVPPPAAFAFAVLVHAVTVLPLAIGGLGAVARLGVSLAGIRSAALRAERSGLGVEPVHATEP